MQPFNKAPDGLVRTLTLGTLMFLVIVGAIMVLFPVKPFWVDEWFIIYSLKTRDVRQLFGQLEFAQQFPRVYLVILKYFTSFFKYGYHSLRLPSYLVSICTIVLGYRLAEKLYDARVFSRYLFILILVSSDTFLEYFVEMKQYPMDILLCVIAVWQLVTLLSINQKNPLSVPEFLLLCISFAAVPFFSYTYPIAIAPAYVVVLMQAVTLLRNPGAVAVKQRLIVMKLVPLCLGAISICAFYVMDVKQLVSDSIMYSRWDFLMVSNDNKLYSFLVSFYTLFSQLGAGLLFENVFGILGVSSFIYCLISCTRKYIKRQAGLQEQLALYSCLVILFTLILFYAKKLPCNPRLNAFTTPGIAILIIYFLGSVFIKSRSEVRKLILPVVLYLGVVGNVVSRYINYFTSPRYHREIAIYKSTQRAVTLAQEKHIPVLITPGIAYPYQQAVTDAGKPDPAVWVLKTFPAYDMHVAIPVCSIADTSEAQQATNRLPANISTALAGDGITFRMITRQ